MVMMPSQMIPLGTPAPDFALPDVTSGETVSLDDVADAKKALLVMFICRHCPFVVHVNAELARIGRDYGGEGVGIVAISANDAAEYPDDAPEQLAAQAKEQGFDFPYLHDDAQEVAKAYSAACTPDLYVFDADRKLVYRGQLDDSRPGNDHPVTGKDLRAALDAVLAGEKPSRDQLPATGCNIKWKKGNAPDYFGR